VGLRISNASGPTVMSFKRMSKLDRLRVVQHQYRTESSGASS